MSNPQSRLRVRTILSGAVLWISINLYFFWTKIAGFIFLLTGLLELVSFILVLVGCFKLVYRLITNSNWRQTKNYLTLLFGLLILVSLNTSSLRFNENTFQSPALVKACYEGTMNTSRLYFRKDGSFEDFNVGWFGHVVHHSGVWVKSGDTLKLEFKGEPLDFIGSELIVKDEVLYKIEGDSLVPSPYYLGNCKGLN